LTAGACTLLLDSQPTILLENGKSQFCKALGNETGRPTLLLDIGSLMGSLVEQTEGNLRQALRIADAMSPCILFCDELEKALSGVGSQGDSGVSTRLFGNLLTWLSSSPSCSANLNFRFWSQGAWPAAASWSRNPGSRSQAECRRVRTLGSTTFGNAVDAARCSGTAVI
jgi:SpoVK/Ycf46/Vps4 family AAA+-type ATPase